MFDASKMEEHMATPEVSQREINLPFMGFYESWYSSGLDSEGDQWCENEAGDRQTEDGVPQHLRLDQSDYANILMDVSDYHKMHIAVCKCYVDAFNNVIGEGVGIELGLAFAEMTSPRFYNFETDRIFAKIGMDVVQKLFEKSATDAHETLAAVIKERHSSRDGFISFYENDLETWLDMPLDEWDPNHLCTLMLAVMRQSGEWPEGRRDWERYVYDAVVDCDSLYHEWECGVDWDKLDAKVKEIREEKLAAWKEEHPGEQAPAWRDQNTGDLFE